MAAKATADEAGTETERALCAAIAGRHLIRFVLSGRERIAEPHDYGLSDGRRRLFFFQVGGASRSGQPLG